MDKLHDEIARVAYELFEKRGRVHGYEMENWLEAEKIVRARHAKTEVSEGKAGKIVKRKTAARKSKEEEARPRRESSKKSATGKKTAAKKTT